MNAASDPLSSPQIERLWPGHAPYAVGELPEDIPTISIYRPSTEPASAAPAPCVVICPGGGYRGHAPHEQKVVADWVNTLGVVGIQLKYRVGPRYHHPAMLCDVTRAVRLIRANALRWNLDPARVAVMGFSAGGHLASTAAVHFNHPASRPASGDDAIDQFSARPDAAILIYPVITLQGPFAHAGSRENLLGADAPLDLVELLSNERHVSAQTPPLFIVHGAKDKAVPPENSLELIAAALRVGVPVELHLYERGQHGFGLADEDPLIRGWKSLCAQWLASRGW